MMDIFNGALTLNRTLLYSLRDSPYVVQRGMLVILLVGLLVGGVNGARMMLDELNPDRKIANLRFQLERAVTQQSVGATTPDQRRILQSIRDNIDPIIELVKARSALPRSLPRPIGAMLQGLGVLVSGPITYLSTLLLWVIFTHISARWLGGKGSMQQMLGLGALSVAPHALDALAFVEFIGGTLSMIASGWGIVILIVGTSVAHKLEIGRATMAVFLFPVIATVLTGLSCCILFMVLVMISAGAGT